MRERQLELEVKADEEAARIRLNELVEEARTGSLDVPRTRRVIAGAYKAVSVEIDKAKAARITGATTEYQKWLKEVPTDVATVLAIRNCISLAIRAKYGSSSSSYDTDVCTIQSLCVRLGRAYETEVKIRQAMRVNPLLMRRTFKYVEADNTLSVEHLRKTYDAAYTTAMQGLADSRLDNRQAVHLGRFGVIACLDAGILAQNRYYSGGKTIVDYVVEPDLLEYILGYDNDDVRLFYDNANTAMFCPPDEWTTSVDGGYLSTRRKLAMPFIDLRRVRVKDRQSIREHFTAEKSPMIFRVANYLQQTAFEVHQEASKLIDTVWQAGGGTLGVPPATFRDKPEYPFDGTVTMKGADDEQKIVLKDWRRRTKAWYRAQKDWRSEILGVRQLKESMDNTPNKYWLPVFDDFRGRWYYRGYPNPHGSDTIRSSIMFADKKELGDRGLYWLKVRTAELHGFDKAPLDERAKWTEDNLDYLRHAHKEPVDRADAWGNDNPVGTFVTSRELIAAIDSGNPRSYRTGIPIHRDASCSGIQHFTALFRDETAAEHVNVKPKLDGTRGDQYEIVAQETFLRVLADLTHDNPRVRRYAEFWSDVGPSRDMAKSPVMTYVYGVTKHTAADAVRGFVVDGDRIQLPFDLKLDTNLYIYMANKLFEGIEKAIPRTVMAMKWLQAVVRALPRDKPIRWTTPSGFLVEHDYPDHIDRRIQIRSANVRSILIRDNKETTNSLKMANAISPNFIHSMDATHYTFTVDRARQEGIHFVGIHDSFGTHPSDVDALGKITREEFLRMYTEFDPVQDFIKATGTLLEPPTRGELDLSQVLDSTYFFS